MELSRSNHVFEKQKERTSTDQLFKQIHLDSSKRIIKTSSQLRLLPIFRKSELKATSVYLSSCAVKNKEKSSKIDESSLISKCLLQLRNEFDKLSKDIKIQVRNINLMKKETSFIRAKIKREINGSVITSEKIEKLEKDTCEMCNKQEEAKMEAKTLGNIIERLKQDELKFRNDFRVKELMLKEKTKGLKVQENNELFYEKSIQKMLAEIKVLLEKLHIDSLETKIKFVECCGYAAEIEKKEKFEHERKERTFELLMIESNDITNDKNRKLREALMVNQTVEKLLEAKMEKMLNENQKLETCYHRIKTKTSVSDPNLLPTKFFSSSSTFKELISKVSLYEQLEQEATEKNANFKSILKDKKYKKLLSENELEGFELLKGKKDDLLKEIFEKELLSKRIKNFFDKISNDIGIETDLPNNHNDKMKATIEKVVLEWRNKEIEEKNNGDSKHRDFLYCLEAESKGEELKIDKINLFPKVHVDKS